MDEARPDQVVGPQQLEGAGHLPRIEIALLPHHVLEERHLGLVDEQHQLAGLGEVGLGGQQGQALEPIVAVPRHGRRGDRQRASRPGNSPTACTRASGTIAAIACQRLAGRRGCGSRPCRRSRSSGPGFFQDSDEHGVAPLDEEADQRVGRGEVEDVVLHDPGRHDQDRLGQDRPGGRRVLDQLTQPVPEHDLAGRDGHRLADHELLGPGRLASRGRLLEVLDKVVDAPDEVQPALFDGGAEDLGVGARKVGGGQDVEELTRHERDDRLVVPRHPADAGRRGLPPLLRREGTLCSQRLNGQVLHAGSAKRRSPGDGSTIRGVAGFAIDRSA